MYCIKTVTFGPVEIRNFNPSTTGDIMTYPRPDICLVNGTAEALHCDQLASLRAITDSSGALINEKAYKPFGEITVNASIWHLKADIRATRSICHFWAHSRHSTKGELWWSGTPLDTGDTAMPLQPPLLFPFAC